MQSSIYEIYELHISSDFQITSGQIALVHVVVAFEHVSGSLRRKGDAS